MHVAATARVSRRRATANVSNDPCPISIAHRRSARHRAPAIRPIRLDQGDRVAYRGRRPKGVGIIPTMETTGPPQLVIVGRQNVGKSTLFNRITASRRSIVGDLPGLTRDRIRMESGWKGRVFEVTDTGGMTFFESEEMPELVGEQVRAAVDSADHVIFVVDGRTELTQADLELAELLRRSGREVSLAVNKCDTAKLDAQVHSFGELGFGSGIAISAEHNRGIDRLLGAATREFAIRDGPNDESSDRPIRVAILGRPNVGKSTLLNQITGAGHSIVSAMPGTTRDAVDAAVDHRGQRFLFVDTAGIRRKGKTREMAEKLSVVMAQRHLRLADVALLLIDPREGVTAQDSHIAGYAHESGKACVIVANKWDLARQTQAAFRRHVREELKMLSYAPIAFVSALTGDRVPSLFPLVRTAARWAKTRIPTSELNRFREDLDMDRVTIPGRRPKLSYVTQVGIGPPTFVFFSNLSTPFHFGLERYLINQLRKRFGFEGTPIVVRSKARRRRAR